MQSNYDKNNIFAKIIRKEIPCNIIYENDFALSFYDISPQAKVHALVIPKGEYLNIFHFNQNASVEEINSFWQAFNKTIEIININVNEGFRTIANTNENGNQEVFHFHIHILAGEKMGKMVSNN